MLTPLTNKRTKYRGRSFAVITGDGLYEMGSDSEVHFPCNLSIHVYIGHVGVFISMGWSVAHESNSVYSMARMY